MGGKIINISIFIALLAALVACKDEKKALLQKKWKTYQLQNNKMDMEVAYMRTYIDTLGKNDPELANALNLDSVKAILTADLERSLNEQQTALSNTLMEFKSNGVAYTTSIDGIDSTSYTIEGNYIKLDEAKLKGLGESMTFEILKLEKDTLRIKLIDLGDTSIVTMIPSL
jgi:hypothetical protein